MIVQPRMHDGFIPCDQVDAAITADVGALKRAPTSGPDRYSALHNLSIALYSRFRCSGDPLDVDAAVVHVRSALRLLPVRHPDRSVVEGNLSLFLTARRGPGDLVEAAAAGGHALAIMPPHDPAYPEMLAQVAQVKYELFQQDSDPQQIDDAVRLLDQAVAMRPLGSDGAREVHLNNAVIRMGRHQSVGSHSDDLDTALSTLDAVVSTDPATAAPGLMNAARSNLAQALNLRFLRVGDERDRARSAVLQGELLQSGDRALAERTTALIHDNIATDAMMNYLRTGRLAELDRAVQSEENALAVVGTGNPARPALLGNLGICLLLRHRARHGVSATSSGDLVEGMHLAHEAVETGGSGAYSATSAATLGTLLLQQSVHAPGASGQVELAERMFQRALAGMPGGSPQRQGVQSLLAQCRAFRSVRTGDAEGLEQAIDEMDRANELLPPSSPLRPGALGVAADLLMSAALLSGGAEAKVVRAVVASRAAVAAASKISAATAFITARTWGDTMWRLGHLGAAGEGYASALRLLHELSRTQLVLRDKDVALAQAGDVTERAAVSLAYSGQTVEAALALETGRAVVLSEALGVEQAQILDVASRRRPDLVAAYQSAAQRLLALQRRALAAGGAGLAASADGVDLSELANAREAVDEALISLEELLGVELLRAPDQASFHAALATTGSPIVFIVASELGGAAIVATAQGMFTSIRLSALTTVRVGQLIEQQAASYVWDDADSNGAPTDTGTGMWTDAMSAITTALAGNAEAVLVPVGQLAALPLHAASHRSSDGRRHFAGDQVTYSYAPNARVMAVSRERARRRLARDVLLVGEPRTDLPLEPLPAAITECELIRGLFPEEELLALLTGRAADLDAVMRYLPRAGVVHFAGHAQVDPGEPMNSALVLAGLDQLSLRDLLMTDLPSTRLVVLSACSTAVIGDRLLDEVVSLPSALVQAGVAGVVGALREVDDVAGALLLARFHDLRRSGALTGAAALAGAQRWLREATNGDLADTYPDVDLEPPKDPGAVIGWRQRRDFMAPMWWAPFVYVGA